MGQVNETGWSITGNTGQNTTAGKRDLDSAKTCFGLISWDTHLTSQIPVGWCAAHQSELQSIMLRIVDAMIAQS